MIATINPPDWMAIAAIIAGGVAVASVVLWLAFHTVVALACDVRDHVRRRRTHGLGPAFGFDGRWWRS